MTQFKEENVTAVIPAYNEAQNIGTVLAVLQAVDSLAHIVVVDDGSDDETAVIVQQWQQKDERLILIKLDHNQGKGNAMLVGADACLTELILFLDADLKGLTPQHIYDLIQQVQNEACAMTVGLFEDGRWQTNATHHFFPFLSGQRCLRWPLFADLYQENINGWSIETALSLHTRLKNLPVTYVMWPGVTHAIRTEKRAGLLGYWSHVKMWWEIGQYVAYFMDHSLIHGTRASPQEPEQPLPSRSYWTLLK